MVVSRHARKHARAAPQGVAINQSCDSTRSPANCASASDEETHTHTPRACTLTASSWVIITNCGVSLGARPAGGLVVAHWQLSAGRHFLGLHLYQLGPRAACGAGRASSYAIVLLNSDAKTTPGRCASGRARWWRGLCVGRVAGRGRRHSGARAPAGRRSPSFQKVPGGGRFAGEARVRGRSQNTAPGAV